MITIYFMSTGGVLLAGKGSGSPAGGIGHPQVQPLLSGRRKRPKFRVGYARASGEAETETPALARTGSSTGAAPHALLLL